MLIGDVLVAQNLVTREDVEAALERQRAEGGVLGDHLIAMGKLDPADLERVIRSFPPSPRSVEDTGLDIAALLNLVTKVMHAGAEEPSKIGGILKLPARVMQSVLEEAKERKLVDVLGATGSFATSEMRFALTEKGRKWAADALSHNHYVGPAPVPLHAFVERIQRQRITNERVDKEAVKKAFANLIISEAFVHQIGPAINSGRSVLLYGPPGNGKTSVAERIGSIFRDTIYIPHCFEVEGQIIKVFDAGIHQRIDRGDSGAPRTLRRQEHDLRWVPCRRPFIVTGGELTLEMLDLSFNPLAKYYEAPLHIKALGGIFTIDDFGRQIVSPEALLNRWIVPLESRVEYLKLHTGKSFSIPFDELVVFSTNLAPRDLMDPAFLRRIPYKLEVGGPTPQEFGQIFKLVAKAHGMDATDEIVDFVIRHLRVRHDFPLASYQPKFLIDQIRSACKFEGTAPQFRPDLLTTALGNLFTKDSPGYKEEAPADKSQQQRAAESGLSRQALGLRCVRRSAASRSIAAAFCRSSSSISLTSASSCICGSSAWMRRLPSARFS